MTLNRHEIKAGAVAYLDGNILANDPRIWQPPRKTPPFKSHPFLCIAANCGQSVWLSLTSNQHHRFLRMEIDKDWRGGGTLGWQTRPQYVNNVNAPFCGPNNAFMAAGEREDLIGYCERPWVSSEGVYYVRREVEKRYKMAKLLGARALQPA